MLVIFGVKLEKKKKVIFSLTQLYGIGISTAIKICNELGLSPNLKIKNLTELQEFQITKKIKEEYVLENNLREEVKANVQHYISNGSVRGFRHKHKLPVRGQRTHSNGKTPRRVLMGIPLKLKD